MKCKNNQNIISIVHTPSIMIHYSPHNNSKISKQTSLLIKISHIFNSPQLQQLIGISEKIFELQKLIMIDHKAQMSIQKLSFLLILLASIWILCYNAQQLFPQRHIIDTYSRLGDNQITQSSFKSAVDILNGINSAQSPLADLLAKYGLAPSTEQQICIILAHDKNQQNWQPTLKSILTQNYSKFQIFYLNNYQQEQKIINYLQENSFNKQKIQVIQDSTNFNYITHFDAGNTYCIEQSIVIYMDDTQRIIGQNAFNIISAFFNKNVNLNLLYTAALVLQSKSTQGNNSYKLSRSYRYPENIITQSNYQNYPYLMTGLIATKVDILKPITRLQLLNSMGNLYKLAPCLAIGINLLKTSKQYIEYLPQPILAKTSEIQYITLDKSLQDQISDIMNKQ